MAANRQVSKGPGAPRTAPDVPFEEWEEEQLEAGLKRLKELHIQLRNLRSTIPRMVQPLAAHPLPPPDELFKNCQAAMAAGIQEVRDFRELFTSEESKKVIEHATQSRKKNPRGIKPWRATEEPDWATLDT